MDQFDDLHYICAVLDGDVDAYSRIVERYQKPIYNLMYRMTGSRADALDLSQDAFIRAFERLDKFQKDKRFFPWLYTIAMNQAKNLLRSSGRVSQCCYIDEWEGCSGLDYPQQQEEFMCSRLDSRVLYDAILQLPTDYREAIVLRYREELSMEDVAEALEISVSGAKMRIHRGLKKLRDLLGAFEKENRVIHPVGDCHAKNR